jgi:hypothetical protein
MQFEFSRQFLVLTSLNSHFEGLSPSPQASGWRSSVSLGSDRDHSPTVASSSEDRGPPPRPRSL